MEAYKELKSRLSAVHCQVKSYENRFAELSTLTCSRKRFLSEIETIDERIREISFPDDKTKYDQAIKLQQKLEAELQYREEMEMRDIISQLDIAFTNRNLSWKHFPFLKDHLTVENGKEEVKRITNNLELIQHWIRLDFWNDEFPGNERDPLNYKGVTKAELALSTPFQLNNIEKYRTELHCLDDASLREACTGERVIRKSESYIFDNQFDYFMLLAERARRHAEKTLNLTVEQKQLWDALPLSSKDRIHVESFFFKTLQLHSTPSSFVTALLTSESPMELSYLSPQQIKDYSGKTLIDQVLRLNPDSAIFHQHFMIWPKFYRLCSDEEFPAFMKRSLPYFKFEGADLPYFTHTFCDLDLTYESTMLSCAEKLTILNSWGKRFKRNHNYQILSVTWTGLRHELSKAFDIGESVKNFIDLICEYTMSDEYIYINPDYLESFRLLCLK